MEPAPPPTRKSSGAGATTDAEVIRRALRVYEWVLAKRRAGVEIHVLEPDGTMRAVDFVGLVGNYKGDGTQ